MVYRWITQGLAALDGIEAYEVAQVLSSRRRLPAAAVSGGIRIVVIFGRTTAGRPLTVAVRPTAGFDHLIIGARDMTDAELARYEQWEATDDE